MRSSFFMPVGTKVGLTPVASITPVQIFCDDVTSLFISGTLTVNIGGADPATYDALDFGSAQRIIQQINNVMEGGSSNALIIDTPSGLSWASITPDNTAGSVNNPQFTIAGSGFSNSGINAIKLSQGVVSGMWLPGFNMNIASDISIVLNAGYFYMSPAVYTLYYSTDNGATWTTTGLTVTAT